MEIVSKGICEILIDLIKDLIKLQYKGQQYHTKGESTNNNWDCSIT